MAAELRPSASSPASSGAAAQAARAATTLVFFVAGAGFANWVVRIPTLKAQLGLSERDLGLALLGVAAGAMTLLPLTPFLLGRYGSRRLIGGSVAAYALCLALPALSSNLLGLFAALLLLGAATGTLDVAMNAQASLIERRLARPVMSSFHAAFSVGGLSGAVLGGVMVSFTAAWLHLLAVALGTACLGALALPHLLTTAPGEQPPSPTPLPSRRGVVSRPLLLLGVLCFCAVFTEGSVNDWSAVYLQQLAASSGGQVALGFALFSLSMAFGRLVGDGLSARLGAARLLRLGALLATLGFLICVLATSPLVGALGFLLVGLGNAAMFPLIVSAAGRLPSLPAGAGVAFVSVFGYSGFLVGPPMIGLTAHHTSLRFGFLLAAAITLLISALASALSAVPHPQLEEA